MRKLINDPETIVAESLAGLAAANRHLVRLLDDASVVVRRDLPLAGKVGVVIGGGSGHEPLFPGLVGPGMGDAAACGAVFTSPSPDVIAKAIEVADSGSGVIVIHGNYAGDNMNFDLAVELVRAQGLDTRTVRVWDDIASGGPDQVEERRGTAADLLVIKVAGASAARGDSLDEVYRLTSRARDNCRSIGVALSSCSIPGMDGPLFEMEEGVMHLGMGLHGESGVARVQFESADAITDRLLDSLFQERDLAGSEVVLLVNGYGSTTWMELHVVANRALQNLAGAGIEVRDTLVGSYCTSQEMAGCSLTLFELDEELAELYSARAHTPAFCMEAGR